MPAELRSAAARRQHFPCDQAYDLLRGILDQARSLRERSQDGEAYRKLRQLLAFAEMPAEIREEAHLALADLLMDLGRYRKARRCLVAALAISPHKADTHFMMALAIDEDIDADPTRAMSHLKFAVKANPDQPAYWIVLGQVAQRLQRTATARTAYRRALQLELTSMSELEDVVVGLVECGRVREAKAALMGSHFRFAIAGRVAGGLAPLSVSLAEPPPTRHGPVRAGYSVVRAVRRPFDGRRRSRDPSA